MSYLNNVRLVFAGRFQSDVSTVNNDVTHYDTETFKPQYQEYSQGPNANGWWNPCGSGAFRLINCKVTQVCLADGTTTTDDPVVGMSIGGSDSTVSAKMVDLDPQMQMVSQIWGLTMRLTNGKTNGLFEGQFMPAAFRDILFGRQEGGSGGDQTATAIYQSVLTDLTWADDLPDSKFLQQLRQMLGKVGTLSVRMMVYSYNMDKDSADFTIGRVSGVIGPAFADEPKTFILGRRFAPLNSTSTANNVNFFNAQMETTQQSITVDLSNALPLLGSQGNFVDIGQLKLVVLLQDNIENDRGLNESRGDFVSIGDVIDYLADGFMDQQGALFTVNDLSDELMTQMQSNPLALLRVNNSINEVVIRETQEGLLVRVDQVVHRLMPTAQANVDFYASRFGVPSVGERIDVTLQRPTDTPIINIPSSAMSLSSPPLTDGQGKTNYEFHVTNPGNPRGYINGQLYFLSYGPADDPNYIQQQLDIITVLVFDAFTVPDVPTWQDIQPIMQQYSNLYPIMSRMLVELGHYESVASFRSLLELAFSRPVSDPNYMPVTRDLSPPQRTMILKWLRAKDAQGNYTLLRGNDTSSVIATMEPCASCTLDTVPVEAVNVDATQEQHLGSKERANAHYRRNSHPKARPSATK